ncbi:MAG: geranylgeranylglycerol-phosphate geranylgeranyltransferase [Promethearchaeota archaeon]
MSLKAFITITRPGNTFVGALTVIIGVLTSYRSITGFFDPTHLFTTQLGWVILLTSLTYLSIAAAGNVVNDIYDLEIDKVNRPSRPLPSGAMSVRQAKAWTVILVFLGLLFSFLTIPFSSVGIWTLAIAALFCLIGLVYAAKGKVMGLLGNFAVSVSFAFGLFYGALITFPFIPPVIWVYFITAASLLQGREAIKGIEDVEGDKLRDVQTIARKYGIPTAARVAAVFNVIGIVGFLLPWLVNWLGLSWTGPLYIILLVPGTICVAASAMLILRNPEKNASRASLADKIGAFLGLVNFILGAL